MRHLLKTLTIGAGLWAANIWGAQSAEQLEFFEKNIRPVLAEHCYECHNSSGKAKGDLSLDWRGGWMAGGDSGPVIKLGKPADSFLLRVIPRRILNKKNPLLLGIQVNDTHLKESHIPISIQYPGA